MSPVCGVLLLVNVEETFLELSHNHATSTFARVARLPLVERLARAALPKCSLPRRAGGRTRGQQEGAGPGGGRQATGGSRGGSSSAGGASQGGGSRLARE